MTASTDAELLDLDDLDVEAFNEFAIKQGWSDGMPLYVPTEDKVARFTSAVRVDNETFAPISPRQVVPTMRSLAANAVMAGCKPEYFPVVLAGLRAVLDPAYNLHGTLATTHPCGQLMVVNGPLRKTLDINCGSNCMGQGRRANATIGRALQLILLNIGGAKPGDMDRSTQGSPAKYSYCFGENEEESPFAPYHERKGFAATDSVVTTMAAEPPHNINDHASNTGKGLDPDHCRHHERGSAPTTSTCKVPRSSSWAPSTPTRWPATAGRPKPFWRRCTRAPRCTSPAFPLRTSRAGPARAAIPSTTTTILPAPPITSTSWWPAVRASTRSSFPLSATRRRRPSASRPERAVVDGPPHLSRRQWPPLSPVRRKRSRRARP